MGTEDTADLRSTNQPFRSGTYSSGRVKLGSLANAAVALELVTPILFKVIFLTK